MRNTIGIVGIVGMVVLFAPGCSGGDSGTKADAAVAGSGGAAEDGAGGTAGDEGGTGGTSGTGGTGGTGGTEGCTCQQDSDCDDGKNCNGVETCDGCQCHKGEALDCDDGVDCTDDSCDDDTGDCVNQPNDDNCDNDVFCDGAEICDAQSDCQAGNDPCDDGVDCTEDSCDEGEDACENVADDDNCDDGLFCNGAEICDAESDCQPGNDPCDDGVGCTNDTCFENIDACQNVADDGACDDANDCTSDSCDADSDCVYQNTTDSCTDGNACTIDDTCDQGECTGAPLDCDDENACTVDSCDTVAGCINDPITCDDGNPCTDDDCATDTGCTVSNNTDACTDGNPCTINEHCKGGLCQDSDPFDCSTDNACIDDHCDPLDWDGDPCYYTNNTLPCDDDNNCTATDACSEGECAGSGNSCGEYSDGCTDDTPYAHCSCLPDYVDNTMGMCVPDDNECNSYPCDDNADCYDPSSSGGDVECTCHTGYTGDGLKSGSGCTDINECQGDPCGPPERADGCSDGIAEYSCICKTGYTAVDTGDGPTCVCNMNGTFALRIKTEVSWTGIDNVEDGSATTYSWARRTQTYYPDGTLGVETNACGGTAADVCGTGNVVIDPEAYGQFIPIHVYDLPTAPVGYAEMDLPVALAGEPFLAPEIAELAGISLTDPLGDWPASRRNVAGGGGTQTNGAVWVDHDGDGAPGITSYGVPPGGTGSMAVEPPFPYGATAPSCPASGGGYLPYAWWPAPVWDPFPAFYVRRVKRFHYAARMISALKGTVDSCDEITGDLIGPDPDGADANTDGEFRADVRFNSCIRCPTDDESSTCADVGCSDSVIAFFDGQGQSQQQIDSSTFIIQRVSPGATCAQVRAALPPD